MKSLLERYLAAKDQTLLKNFVITQDHLDLYSRVSGDLNKIHLEEVVAKALGLPSTIAHGQFCFGLIQRVILEFCAEMSRAENKNYSLKEVSCRFSAIVPVNSTVSVKAKVGIKDSQIVAWMELADSSSVIEAKASIASD